MNNELANKLKAKLTALKRGESITIQFADDDQSTRQHVCEWAIMSNNWLRKPRFDAEFHVDNRSEITFRKLR